MSEQIVNIKQDSVSGILRTGARFVVLIGLVSLFSDMTYEAARSINGPYLDILGTSGTTVGMVAGLGELLGYGLRLISGYLSDRTQKYWTITITGYVLNLISVPLLAVAGYWQVAVVLMISERIGRAIRTPARDAMLSYASKEMGRGWAFGLHEALDSTGATIGPLLVSAVLFFQHQSYKIAYTILIIPAVIAIIILLVARSYYPNPANLEVEEISVKAKGYPRKYWLYLLAVVFIAAGYADFSLIAFHFKKMNLMKDSVIPLIYSAAMFSQGLSALALGKLFDRFGMKTLSIVVLISLAFAPMVFLGNIIIALGGMILWGIGMGAQESIVKAAVAQLIPPARRGTAFGLFNTGFGVFWFIGSALMGWLYDVSITGLIIFSVVAQVIAFIILSLVIVVKNNQNTALVE